MFGWKRLSSIVILCIASLPLPAQKPRANQAELRQELQRLKQVNAAQQRAIQVLEQRLQAVEATQQPKAGQRIQASSEQASRLEPAASERGEQTPAQQQSEGEAVREPRPSKSTEDILLEEHTLFGHRFIIEPSFNWSHFDRDRLELSGLQLLDTLFFGNFSVDNVESDILTFDLTTRYTPSDRLQLDLDIPFVYRTTKFRSTGGDGGSTEESSAQRINEGPGLGDINFGLSYRLFPETATRPDVVWLLRAKAPTGSDPFGIDVVEVPGSAGNLRVPQELPTGTGTWQIGTGFSLLKSVDPAILFANLQYFHEFEGRFSDIEDDPGTRTPGAIDLGDAMQFGVGVAFALNERLSLSVSYSQRLVNEAERMPEGGPSEEIEGSDANIGIYNVGATYALTDRLSVISNLGVGLTEDASDLSFGMRLPYSF